VLANSDVFKNEEVRFSNYHVCNNRNVRFANPDVCKSRKVRFANLDVCKSRRVKLANPDVCKEERSVSLIRMIAKAVTSGDESVIWKEKQGRRKDRIFQLSVKEGRAKHIYI